MSNTTRPRPTDTDPPDADRQFRSEARYKQLLRTVEHNTGGPGHTQRAGVRRCELHLILVSHGSYNREALKQSIRTALTDEVRSADLVEWRDEDGVSRLARRTEQGLKMVIAEQNMREEPDVELQAWAADQLEAIKGD